MKPRRPRSRRKPGPIYPLFERSERWAPAFAGKAFDPVCRHKPPRFFSGGKILGEILFYRDRAADDPERMRLTAEGLDRLSVLLEAIGVEIGTHQRLGFLEFEVEPGGDIGKLALRFGELLGAAIKSLREAARDPLLALPD